MIDCDGKGTYDYIGSYETTLGSIMGAKRQVIESPLLAKGIGNRGKIIVRAEAVQTSKQIAKFKMQWKSLNNLSAGFIGIGRKRQIVKFKI